MSLTLQEDHFVVIDVGSSVTRAGMGMHDTNKVPSVVCIQRRKKYPIPLETHSTRVLLARPSTCPISTILLMAVTLSAGKTWKLAGKWN